MSKTPQHFEPRDYQREGIDWVLRHERCCLFLDMGLGKTVQTLTAVQQLLDACEVSRVLVVAPKKVADTTWQTEAEKWLHLDLRVQTVAGTPAQRLRALLQDADVYVAGRDTLAWLSDAVDSGQVQPFDMLVLDELTSYKNHCSSRHRAALKLSRRARRVVGLTGTPRPQGLADLFGQLLTVDLGQRLGTSVTRFRNTYFHVFRHGQIIKLTPRKGASELIEHLIGDICLTMLSEERNPRPELTETIVPVVMTDDERERYRKFEKERVLELQGQEVTAAEAAVLLGKLAQYTGGAVYDDEGNPVATGRRKLEALLAEVKRGEGQVLVFYQYRHEAERIEAALDAEGLRCRRYRDGTDLRAWNAGEAGVLLAHPASTAYGLNLQYGGHRMVWYGLPWSLELYEQAVARLWRQGQRHAVENVVLVCPGTVDDRILAALRHKGRGQKEMMQAMSALLEKYEVSPKTD